ncbi:MAG TPA: RNase P subunit p30 family protein [Candidatus Norongarragalinales archaeon]|nr:RNase P subunit p30 family protein [Candidatus Norongarragalinales archaeon]
MTIYHDWNVPENLHKESENLGWVPHVTRRFFLRNSAELKKVQGTCSVSSESSELLRQASKRAKLINPTLVKGFDKDVGLVRTVAERGGYFEIPLRPLLHAWGVPRAIQLQRMRDFFKLAFKLKALVVFSSQAESGYDLKSPFEVLAMWQEFGMTREQAVAALGRTVDA